ncbi:MAG: hypothetical protein ACJ72O_06130 [Marmoricola sp.]
MSGSHRGPETRRSRYVADWVDRRADRLAQRDAEDRAAGRAERVPAPRLKPRRPTSSGPRWYSTGRGQLLLGGGAVLLAVLLRILVPGGDDDPGAPLGAGLPHFGADWTAAGGARYRITVTPLASLSSKASDGGCVRAPADGFVNARFGVRIENLGTGSVPVPKVDFGANLDASGSADPTLADLPTSRSNVALTPAADGARCAQASSLRPGGRSELKPGGILDLVGTVGGISIPVEPGVAVIVRYTTTDGTQELLAPFPAFPVGS